MDKIHVYLSIHDPAPASFVEITELVGLEPTMAWTKGDPVPDHPTARRTFSAWTLDSPLERSATFEDHLEALLPILEGRADRIRLAKERFGASINCAAYFSCVNPGFGISEAHLARLATLGLSLDFDLYCLGAAPAEDDEQLA